MREHSMASQNRRKTPDIVKMQEAWCCIGRPLASSPIVPSSRLSSRQASKHQKEDHKPQKKGNVGKSKDGTGEALKNGEIAALIKQGFIHARNLDKTGSGTPFGSFITSPGRISPVVDTSALPQSSSNSSSIHEGAIPPLDEKKLGPTLYDMISGEHETETRALDSARMDAKLKELFMRHKISSECYNQLQLNDHSSSDVKLTLRNKEGVCVRIHAHSRILALQSQYFAAMLDEMLSEEHPQLPHFIEIADCEDIELYLETLHLMYSHNIKQKLLKGNVHRVLGILKICASIAFEKGMLHCLEYLEAMPWAEEDEPKVMSLLLKLNLGGIGAGEVLQRVSTDQTTRSDNVLMSLIQLITRSTNDKARREMKGLVSRMLRENVTQGYSADGLSKESLLESSHACVNNLVDLFMRASAAPDIHISRMSEERGTLTTQIIRQADNLSWLVDIMIDRQIADDFIRLWAFQAQLASLHPLVPVVVGRYEVSCIMARLCVALGKGQILAPKEVRYELLHNWLQPLIDDFGWMQRACKGLDMAMVEEGLCQTISTLPLKQQQFILVAWFERFLKSGDDCPKLQRAFEVWWRRTYANSMELSISSMTQF